MGDRFRRLPSPSMGVAFIALLAALGGTAVALPGSNNVTSGDIRKGAVGTSDIKNNSGVRTQDIRNSTIRGGDVRANTLTGSDINEGTLGTVPSANTANSANSANTANSASTAGTASTVGNVRAQGFTFQVPAGTPSTRVLTLGGLTIDAVCTAGADLDVTARNVSGVTSSLRSLSHGDGNSTEADVTNDASQDGNWASNATKDLVPVTANDQTGVTVFTAGTPVDSTVTVNWTAEDINVPGADECLFGGNALQNG